MTLNFPCQSELESNFVLRFFFLYSTVWIHYPRTPMTLKKQRNKHNNNFIECARTIIMNNNLLNNYKQKQQQQHTKKTAIYKRNPSLPCFDTLVDNEHKNHQYHSCTGHYSNYEPRTGIGSWSFIYLHLSRLACKEKCVTF